MSTVSFSTLWKVNHLFEGIANILIPSSNAVVPLNSRQMYATKIFNFFLLPLEPEPTLNEAEDGDRSMLRKVFGAGKSVVTSTVNYGNQVTIMDNSFNSIQ